MYAFPGRFVLRASSVSKTLIAAMPAPLFSVREQSTDTASGQPKFTYRIAAASAGKRTLPRPAQAGRDFWGYSTTENTPRSPYLRSTKKDSGEDAFFAATVGGDPHHVAFGVADGVGGWQDSGVDPSDFSHGLCGLMAGTAYSHEGLPNGENVRPQKLLQTAYDAVLANPRILAGGCTASLAVADVKGNMETANLGDSGFLILAPGKISQRSEPQTHAFNTPYQLSKVPPKMQAQHAIFGGATHFSETPSQADVSQHALRHGDIVVFATDGVWDNLSAQDTLEIVTRIMQEGGFWFPSHNFNDAETLLNHSLIRSIPGKVDLSRDETYLPASLATAIMREAKVAGLDRRRNGPFAKEVKRYYPNEPWNGGKPDDIAVIVCVAVQEEVQEKAIKAKL